MTSKTETLLAEARACTICAPHLPLGPRPVFQIHPSARILIVGQAPGRKVHETGIPFNDASGDRLRRWLGVTREQFYDKTLFAILPMGFCYPGTGKGGDLPPRPECAANWQKPMRGLLHSICLSLYMGRYAVDYYMPDVRKLPLNDIVGDWRKHWPDMMVMPHPSPRNIAWFKRNPWFEQEAVPTLQARVNSILQAASGDKTGA